MNRLKIGPTQVVIILLSLVIIGLVFYVFNPNNRSSTTTESLFEKQNLCASSRESAQKQLDDAYKLATPFFYDIFYSPKTETCVYTYGLILLGESPNEIGSFTIADYFTGEQLYSIQYDNSSDDENQFSYEIRPQFEDEVKKYKR